MFGRRFYIVVFALVLISGAVLLVRYGLESRGGAGRWAAPADIVQRIATLEQRLAKMPNDADLLSDLAGAYMRKARAVGDPEWYSRAQQAAERALAVKPNHYPATRMMAWVFAGQHRFEESLVWARKAQAMQPNDAWNYGTMGDADLELGDYDAAADAFQRMVELRPDVTSYSRAAHLRELLGDRAGAIEIMKLAVRAASPRDPENLAWCLAQLGKLYFNGGNLDAAERAFDQALNAYPDSHLAVAARARVSAARGRDKEAISLLERAARWDVPDVHILLGDLYARRGDARAAEREYARAERLLLNQGKMARHELAAFYADHDRNIAKAVEWMREDLRTARDIAAFDTMAWAAYKAGLIDEALSAIIQALRLGTQDARLFYHAGMIFRKAGETEKAEEYLRRAAQVNPYFDVRRAPALRAAL